MREPEFCPSCGNYYPDDQICDPCKEKETMTDIKPGTRVRVTYEGVVEEQGTFILNRPRVRADDRLIHIVGDFDTVEILAPPERKFEDGAYYRTPLDQHVLRYSAETDCFVDRGVSLYRQNFRPEQLARFIKLVPEEES